MLSSKCQRFTVTTALLVAFVLGVVFSPLIWTRAAGETTINEDSLLLTDGSNSMQGNLNMSENEIQDGVFHKGTSFPSSPVEGQWYYRTDLDEAYVYDGTQWIVSAPAGTSSGSQIEEVSYTIFPFNTTHTSMKNGTTGAIDAINSDPTDIINWAISNLTEGDDTSDGGTVFIRSGTYTLTDEILILGDPENGQETTPTEKIIIRGESQYGTELRGATTKNVIHFSNNSCFEIRDLTLKAAFNNPDDIIYGEIGWSGSGSHNRSCSFSLIENVYLYGGSGTGGSHWGMNIESPFCLNMRGINRFLMEGVDGGGGIRFIVPAGYSNQFGDSKIEGILRIGLRESNQIGLCFQGIGKQATLVRSDAQIHISGLSAKTNQTGIWCEWMTDSHFENWQFEQLDVGIYVTGNATAYCKSLNFENGIYQQVDDGGTLYYVADSNSADIIFTNTHRIFVSDGDTVTILNDTCTSSTFPTQFTDSTIYESGSGTAQVDITSTTILRNIQGDMGKSENSGSTTVQNDEWITHGLISIPDSVSLTCKNATYDSVPIVVSHVDTNSTHFQVGVYWTNGTAIATDGQVSVYWYTRYTP